MGVKNSWSRPEVVQATEVLSSYAEAAEAARQLLDSANGPVSLLVDAGSFHRFWLASEANAIKKQRLVDLKTKDFVESVLCLAKEAFNKRVGEIISGLDDGGFARVVVVWDNPARAPLAKEEEIVRRRLQVEERQGPFLEVRK